MASHQTLQNLILSICIVTISYLHDIICICIVRINLYINFFLYFKIFQLHLMTLFVLYLFILFFFVTKCFICFGISCSDWFTRGHQSSFFRRFSLLIVKRLKKVSLNDVLFMGINKTTNVQ